MNLKEGAELIAARKKIKIIHLPAMANLSVILS